MDGIVKALRAVGVFLALSAIVALFVATCPKQSDASSPVSTIMTQYVGTVEGRTVIKFVDENKYVCYVLNPGTSDASISCTR